MTSDLKGPIIKKDRKTSTALEPGRRIVRKGHSIKVMSSEALTSSNGPVSSTSRLHDTVRHASRCPRVPKFDLPATRIQAFRYGVGYSANSCMISYGRCPQQVSIGADVIRMN
jgi:hypothetical protein